MKKTILSAAALCAIITGCGATTTQRTSSEPATSLTPITIAQFGHVFLYMPLYVAIDRGFFRDNGIDVKLVSTGGDEKTFTAVATGNAQFGVSDPTFTAIAAEHGKGGKVVAGVVRGVPFWFVTLRKDIGKFANARQFNGYRVACFTAPSTSFAVTKKILQNNGKPVNSQIVQGAFGTLPALLSAGKADIAIEIEPTVSLITNKGGHLVYDPTVELGDFAFTGLEVSDEYLKNHNEQVQSVVNGLAEGMKYIQTNFDDAVIVAEREFPDVDPRAVHEAMKRLKDSQTMPANPYLPEKAWDAAIALRREIGDIKGSAPYNTYVDMSYVNRFMQQHK